MQSKIAELLHQYFELGAAEGREGRNHDTEAGDAQRVLSEIEAEIAALSAAEPGKPFCWLSKHEVGELAVPASSNRHVKAWRQPNDKEGRELVPLYLSSPAPSVAVKALQKIAEMRDNEDADLDDILLIADTALSAQVQDVAGWRYDLEAAPTGLMEFAFTNSIGFCNVRICERMGHQTDSGLRYFYREDGQKADLNANGWRAYAWRKVEVPHLYPAAPAKQEG